MRTDVSMKSGVGAVLRACLVCLGLGLAALLGVLLIGAQPSGAQVPVGAPRSPAGNPLQGTPTTTPTCAPAWRVVSSPNTGSSSTYLHGVAAVSANDVWAVGESSDGALKVHWDGNRWSIMGSPSPGGILYGVAAVSANDVWAVGEGRDGTLVEHWDGTSWSVVPSPNPCAGLFCANVLQGVAAVSANEVWAVGYYLNEQNDQFETLVERWNGTSWSVAPSPNPPIARGARLKGVAVASANDVWAVGEYFDSNSLMYQTLVERWNGTSWSIVPSPNPPDSAGRLHGVAVVSARDVWAVGERFDFSGKGAATLVEHWDGSSWSIVSSPNPPNSVGVLYGVAVVSARDVWAVGEYYDSSFVPHTLVERWNGTSWSVVPSPTSGTGGSGLDGVAVVSGGDVWAVGDYYAGNGPYQTLVEHWNGTSWSIVGSPNTGSASDYLSGVAALSADDMWAVGKYYNGRVAQTLVEHWNGRSWSVLPSPNPPTAPNAYLNGVAVVSANDVWAVGASSDNEFEPGRTLVERWDGGSWSIVDSPNPGEGNILNGVAVVSASNVWAVGSYYSSSAVETLVERWDGSSWRVVSSPNPPNSISILEGVAVVSADDAWAVGYYWDSSFGPSQTLVEHWDGSSWSIVSSPSPGQSSNSLSGVVAVSADDVWAVGNYSDDPYGFNQTLVEHWDGSSWSIVGSSGPGQYMNDLKGVAAVPAGDVWAVGSYSHDPFGESQTLVEHWDGSSWSIVGSPNPGTRGNGLGGVAAVPGNEVWAVGYYGNSDGPERTLVEWYSELPFTDVDRSDYFYEPVRYLYCHGVISGYADSTLRPYNLTTRGQLCKIAVLAEGWSIYTPPTPTFRDVPVTDPFYSFIETAYNHGIISGYGCGGGCLEFRPGNNVTRGQACKIVVLGEGWPLYTPPAPTFRDVADTHTFYPYIETAYSHGIISGYNCGAGCLEFRPGNNATRGQLCKIVYQAVTQP